MYRHSQPKLNIYVFQYHLNSDQVRHRLGKMAEVEILTEANLNDARHPMEFRAYSQILRGEPPAEDCCAIVCNDTVLTKEYSGFLMDVHGYFKFIATVSRPIIVGVLDRSLFGISIDRPSPLGLHLRSHFFMVNRAGWDLMAERMASVCDKRPDEFAVAIASNFFDTAHVGRKSSATAAEQHLSDIIFANSIVLDCSLSRKIALRRLMFEAKRYIFCR